MTNIEVVVTGMAVRLPGSDNKEIFWNNLLQGITSIKSDTLKYNNGDKNGAFSLLKDIDRFDNRFFNISEREARAMDPQHRIILEQTYQCVLDSGIDRNELQHKLTNIYVGAMGSDYGQLSSSQDDNDSYSYFGSELSILANRISYFFNFKGESMPVLTASSSSLVAIDMAIKSIKRNQCQIAIVAGININFHPWKAQCFMESMMLSKNEGSRPFDRDGDGYAIGDGAIVLMLQERKSALKNKQYIYGKLVGSAVRHGGKAVSLYTPQVKSQEETILCALADANEKPEHITYVEAHGSGTPVGDPVEYETLTKAYCSGQRNNKLIIGTIKPNVGHLEACAGIAGLAKVLLMCKYNQIPPTIKHDKLNPLCVLSGNKLIINKTRTNWKKNTNNERVAGISSFGIGGINCHVIVKQDNIKYSLKKQHPESLIIPVSAHSEQSMTKEQHNISQFLHGKAKEVYEKIASLTCKREQQQYRSYAICSAESIISELVFSNPVSTKSTKGGINIYLENSLFECDFLSAFSGGYRCVDELTNEVLKDILNNDSLKSLFEGFNNTGSWGSHKALYSKVAEYISYKCILNAGLNPCSITADEDNSLLALVLANAISSTDFLQKLIDPNYKISIIAMPHCKIWMNDSKSCIAPYNVSFTYIQTLVQQQITLQEIEEIVSKVRPVYEYAPQLRTLCENWSFAKKSLHSWITGDAEIKEFGSDLNKFMIIGVFAALSEYSSKWGIDFAEKYLTRFGIELVALIKNGVLQPSTLEQILLEGKKDGTFNQVEHLEEYPYLQAYNEPKVIQQIRDILSRAASRDTLSGQLNDKQEQDKGNSNFTIRETDHLLEKIAELWIAGVNIDWSFLYPKNTFNIQPVPIYSFDDHRFWLKEDSLALPIVYEIKTEKANSWTTTIKKIISDICERDIRELQDTDRLSTIGFDSMLETKLKHQIESTYQVQIPSSILASNISVGELVKYVNEKSNNKNSDNTLLESFLNHTIDIHNLDDDQIDTLLSALNHNHPNFLTEIIN